MENLNVLVEAKKEYTGQLCMIMCPQIIESFDNLYNLASVEAKRGEIISQFQKRLKDVKEWSDVMIKKHVDGLTQRCGWFRDLLAAVFVSHVKILSAVRLKAENKKISLSLPTNSEFVGLCYENCARYVYLHPEVYHEASNEIIRDRELTTRFCECIEETIRQQIPIQKILQTYISHDSDNMEFNNELEDNEDPDVMDETEETEEPDEPEEEPMEPQEPMETDALEELKEVPVSEPVEEDLFPNAPDKMKKSEV